MYETEITEIDVRSALMEQLYIDLKAKGDTITTQNTAGAALKIQAETWAALAEANAGSGGGGTPTLPPGGIVTDGQIDQTKFNAMAAAMSSDAGVAYRFGAATAPISGLPTYFQPEVKFMPMGDIRSYNYGSYTEAPGDFASNILHINYVPDNPSARLGVAGIQATSVGHNTVSFRPEISWVLYGQGLDSVEAVWWKNHGFPNLANPICIGHAHGRPGWATQSLAAFQNGFICTAGANTMTNRSYCQLRAGLVPTSITCTSSNEFALVTCWDTVNFTSVVAFISLTGLGHNATIQNPYSGTDEGWWGEWNEPHPGMHNLGNLAYMKIVGYLDVGLKAATGVSATTGHPRFGYLNGSGAPIGTDGTTGNTGNWSDEAQRQKWATGVFNNRYARQGMAMVISKTEKKVVFIDLKPLFAYQNSKYFGTRSDYLETTNIGDGAGQWPYTFTERPAQVPTVVKTISLASAPTSVMIFPYAYEDYARLGFVGTEDGQLHVYSTGDYARPGATGNAANIAETTQVFVGANPTCIDNVKEKAGGPPTQTNLVNDVSKQYVVTSRAEKAIRWVEMTSANTAVIKRKLQDSRIVDPIKAVDTDNHGTEHYSVVISDYNGRAAHQYLWGDTILHTYANQRFALQAAFEYGGAFNPPGKVVEVLTANIS